MIWIFLNKAVAKEGVVLTPGRRGNVVLNVLKSAIGQAYALKKSRLQNKGKTTLHFQHN